jgi:hypothetical protein
MANRLASVWLGQCAAAGSAHFQLAKVIEPRRYPARALTRFARRRGRTRLPPRARASPCFAQPLRGTRPTGPSQWASHARAAASLVPRTKPIQSVGEKEVAHLGNTSALLDGMGSVLPSIKKCIVHLGQNCGNHAMRLQSRSFVLYFTSRSSARLPSQMIDRGRRLIAVANAAWAWICLTQN